MSGLRGIVLRVRFSATSAGASAAAVVLGVLGIATSAGASAAAVVLGVLGIATSALNVTTERAGTS